MGIGILVGYFAKQDEARKAFQKLAQEGFSQTALISVDADGAVQVSDPFLWRSLVKIALITVLSALFGLLATLLLEWPGVIAGSYSSAPYALILAGAAIGFLAALPLLWRSRYAIPSDVLRNHARWLVSGETVLIIRATVASLQRPVALLRESGDIPPVLFVMHPKRDRRTGARTPQVKLSLAQLVEHARRHAGEQQMEPELPHTLELLKRVKQSRRWIRRICEELTAASRLEQQATPIADWILDNEYIMEGSVRDVLLNLPREYYQQLPTLASEPYRGLPCIYGLAKNLVLHTELRLDQENILAFIEACQSVRALKIGELWAIPQMLRIALVESIQNLAVTALTNLRERQLADFWANRLIAANRRDSKQLFAIMTELAATEASPSHYFGAQLVGLLYDEAAALAPVKNWLERTLNTTLHDLILREQNRQTAEQISCGNAFTSLRHLAHLDWNKLFERLSRVEQILRCDPSGIYAGMDFATRDRCRQVIEELARAGELAEEQVAECVVKLALEAGNDEADDMRRRHVGYWLRGEGRALLARLLNCRETLYYRALEWVYQHHGSFYGGAIAGFLFVVLAGLVRLAGQVGPVVLLLLLIPVSQLAIEAVNYLILRLLPPRTLPKMDFRETGIPDAFRTLIVVPMMLVNEETIRGEVEKLEIRYLANREDNLFFSLFSDYTDAANISSEDDGLLLRTVQECMESLDKRHGGGRFFLFHRERRWCKSERKFIGWERKRGKLEELNRLIDGTRPVSSEKLVYVGDAQQLAKVRFIITLDSDTCLPHATARRMVETLAHPLNQPRFAADGTVMPGSFTIIQPRVSPTLPSASASLFSRLFCDAVGIDPYTRAVSDLYQDLSGEGSYHGKGIYDVRAFSRILSGRFPDDRILSHDLIEGVHVRVGLASDIELYDDFPQGYQSYCSRNHRWIRGDWQIADWILPQVPNAFGGYVKNSLSLFNRWKILDNLRRSLLPAANLVLLAVSWLNSPETGVMATLVVALQLLFAPLTQLVTLLTTLKGFRQFSLPRFLHDLLRSVAEAALLPHQAALNLDAIVRVCYRRLISGRNLLEWTPQSTHWSASRRQSLFVARMALASTFSAVAVVVIWRFMPDSLPQAAPWLVLWFSSPVQGWLLNQRPVRQQSLLSASDNRFLRQIARRTWRYFSRFVNAETSWLPPDNYQVAHQNNLAMRTSPTNIGLWMTSALGGYDCGYLTIHQLLEKLTNTMTSIDRLERHEGHLLNWYDIRTLTPLEPRYVSTVDSGNLLAALWTLQQGMEELLHAPIIDSKAFAGFHDTGMILKQVAGFERRAGFDLHILDELLDDWEAPLTRVIDHLRLLRRTGAMLRIPLVPAGADSWAGEMEEQTEAWISTADRYLSWIEILGEKSAVELVSLGETVISSIRRDLDRPPSLSDLAEGRIGSIQLLRSIRAVSPQFDTALQCWLDRLLEAFAAAQAQAAESLGMIERLAAALSTLSDGMNMGFLYDARQKLFTIGYNVSLGRPDVSCYDLLASEARLGSFLAIAGGDVPMEHWFSLGRPYGAIVGHRVLLSWTGTMFEYLMPVLFQHSYAKSLLDKAAGEAVSVQMDYGKKHGVPWGVSESAFADLDLNRTYQYKAFGVPALGLKRGLEEQVVIAPYATLLALNVAPQETVQNLKELANLGLLADYGFFEAMDFSRQSKRSAGSRTLKRGVIVEAYMAHHQGMAFMALTNQLQGNPFPRRFHADPRVRAFETLLQERIPALPPLHLISTRQSQPTVQARDLITPAGNSFTTPHTATPRTLLLSNGSYGLMVTNSGGGYSQWKGQELTRWRSDQTCDPFGSFCYIHEPEKGHLWSTSWQPTGGTIKGYAADFTLDRAVFGRTDHGIHLETEIIVSPEDDLELRRITLINRSSRTRRLSLTSYVELSMAPHNADRQHPAFNKLFIQTEALPEQQALLAHRRPRSESEAPLYVAHGMTVHQPKADAAQNPSEKNFTYETDRKRFIGRGRTLMNPMGATQEPGNSQGFVLDPVFSLRRTIVLKPGQRIQVSLLLAAGASREQVLLLLEKYADPHIAERAMDFAWGASQQQLQMLHIRPDEARRFQQLSSHLLYPNQFLRTPARRLEDNRKGQAGLWPYAISGDCPLVLITIGETRDAGLVRQMLQAHTYWQMHGLSVDIVILNEEAGSYERPLKERLEQMVRGHILFGATDRPGRIYLKSAAQIPQEDLHLFKAAASVVLVAARGTLAQQLGAAVDAAEAQETLEAIVRKRVPPETSAPLPFMELHYFNSIGGFTRDGREYAIYLGPGVNTPAPWVNVIANPAFGAMVSETGSGFTWYGNSQRNRLTGWSNDPVLDQTPEALYLRDEESGVYWSPTAGPVRDGEAYRARHGAGYTVFEHNSNGIGQELTLFVPMDENGGAPVKLQRLRITNASSTWRRLSLTWYLELTLGENRETSQMHVMTTWDDEAQTLFAHNRYHPEYGERVTFMAVTPQADSFGGDRSAFIGRNRSLASPAAMELVRLSQRTGAGLDPCGALRVAIELSPGQQRDIICILGQAGSLDEARSLSLDYQQEQAFEQAFDRTRGWWDDLLGTIEVNTPELAADLLINRWLQYQSLSCRIWGRSAFYQSGGAYGFRDQLQDVMAFLYVRPELAREQILLAASRQFREGDVQHWWHPPTGAGIRSRITDDLLWLPYVTARYVRTTGDLDILGTEIPFLTAPVLADDQHELFFTPEVAAEQATLFEHCRRAVSRGLTIGPSGLPLIGTGDWNDGMNLVGAEGKGESVWLGWFLCDLLQGMAELSELLHQPELSRSYREDRSALIRRIEQAAWDGAWYLRGRFDDGTALGSAANAEARIDSLPQSWAWLSGAADPLRAEQALESAWQHLVKQDEQLVLLFEPPFENSKPSPGYIKGYPPGVRENGGQYTHAALWMAMALARKGDGERAVQLLRMLNPIEHTRDAEAVWRYGVEPYVAAADVYRLPGRSGQGGWSWYTGSAAWMYRAWVEEVLGVQVRDGTMGINPVIPANWPGFSLKYRHGEALYDIRVENPDRVSRGVIRVELDGQRLQDGLILLDRGQARHDVVVVMG